MEVSTSMSTSMDRLSHLNGGLGGKSNNNNSILLNEDIANNDDATLGDGSVRTIAIMTKDGTCIKHPHVQLRQERNGDVYQRDSCPECDSEYRLQQLALKKRKAELDRQLQQLEQQQKDQAVKKEQQQLNNDNHNDTINANGNGNGHSDHNNTSNGNGNNNTSHGNNNDAEANKASNNNRLAEALAAHSGASSTADTSSIGGQSQDGSAINPNHNAMAQQQPPAPYQSYPPYNGHNNQNIQSQYGGYPGYGVLPQQQQQQHHMYGAPTNGNGQPNGSGINGSAHNGVSANNNNNNGNQPGSSSAANSVSGASNATNNPNVPPHHQPHNPYGYPPHHPHHPHAPPPQQHMYHNPYGAASGGAYGSGAAPGGGDPLMFQRMQAMQDSMLASVQEELSKMRIKVEQQAITIQEKSIEVALLESNLEQSKIQSQQQVQLAELQAERQAQSTISKLQYQLAMSQQEAIQHRVELEATQRELSNVRLEVTNNRSIIDPSITSSVVTQNNMKQQQQQQQNNSNVTSRNFGRTNNNDATGSDGSEEEPAIDTNNKPTFEVDRVAQDQLSSSRTPTNSSAVSSDDDDDDDDDDDTPLQELVPMKKAGSIPPPRRDTPAMLAASPTSQLQNGDYHKNKQVPSALSLDDDAPPSVPLSENITMATFDLANSNDNQSTADDDDDKEKATENSGDGDKENKLVSDTFTPKIRESGDADEHMDPLAKAVAARNLNTNSAAIASNIMSSMDDDNRSIGQTVASSTYGEDRQKVVNKPLLDPYGDKGIYTGVVLRTTGMPHGLGRMIYEEDGRVYEGDWRHGRWHGYGRASFSNGDNYEGEYKFDQRHGHGVYCWNDGRIYDGMFSEDKRHGKGKFTWPDGAIYEGEFVNGQREGQGSYTFSDGGQYVGCWLDGRYDGFGTCTWEDGRRYKGEWRNGMAHGRGIETYPTGKIRHEGQWIDDEPIR